MVPRNDIAEAPRAVVRSHMTNSKWARMCQILFSKIKQVNVWSGRSLGYYLLCVSLCESGYQLWLRASGGVDQSWSRFGFRVFFSIGSDLLNLGDSAPRVAYYISVAWLFILAVAMIRKRLPLKMYIAGEILMGFPSASILWNLDSDSKSRRGDLIIFAVFLFETAIPVVWATVLACMRWKSRPLKVRVIPVGRTKAFGFYLLGVSLYQVVVLPALYFFPERLFDFARMLQARYGLYVFLQLIGDALNGFELPDYFWPAIWLTGLALAVLFVFGRQPIKTYMLMEIFLGIPGAIYVATNFLTWGLDSDIPLWERFVGAAVFLFATAFPLCWACWLLWTKWRIKRATSVPAVSG